MNADDPLLAAPTDDWLLAPARGVDALGAAFAATVDYMNMAAIAWPARDQQGHLVPPPPEHVLDHLARAYDLAPEDDILIRPAASTVCVTSELEDCDFCTARISRYDAELDGVRGFACPDCYDARGAGVLGASGDCYLMLSDEVPADVRSVCDEITNRQGLASIWA